MTEKSPGELSEDKVRMQAALAIGATDAPIDQPLARAAALRLNLLEAMMETVPVGVVLADSDGQIIHGNRHVEEMVRHPVLHSDDVDSYGEWVSFHADGSRVQSHEYPLSRVLRDDEERSELDVHYQRGDGTRFWMRVIGEPVRDADGQVIGATVALIDIDEERRLQDAKDILIRELNHRVKNAFSVVKSIVSQSLRKVSIQAGLRETIDKRLDAYATAHAKLIGESYDFAPLMNIAQDILDPIGDGRIDISGPDIAIPSRPALAFSMTFYELATNAVKYGALSVPDGRVQLSWNQREGEARSICEMSWIERGGPPPQEPEELGFGSFITGRALQLETGGTVTSQYPKEGFEWRLVLKDK